MDSKHSGAKRKDIFDGQDTTEEITGSGSLNGLMNCKGFIEYYIIVMPRIQLMIMYSTVAKILG